MKTTNETLKKRMLKHQQAFERIWPKIVKDVNDYKNQNPDQNFYSFENSGIETFIDSLCLSGAWIQDRLNNKSGLTHNPTYKKSLTRKIRNALGYSL
jgi:hypothetical protein